MKITEILDVVIGVLFLVSVLLGYYRGLVLTIARLAAMAAAYIGARSLAVLTKGILGQQIMLPILKRQLEENPLGGFAETAATDAAEGAAYSLVFCIALFVLELILLRLVNGFKLVDCIPVVGKLNKLGGAVAGFLWVFLLCLVLGNVFFTYIPKEMQHRMGFTEQAVQETVLLSVFVPQRMHSSS